MDFDNMLEELGEMGRFQIRTYILVCLPVLFAGANSLSYVFTAGVPNYRCLVPECESALDPQFEQSWTRYAAPEAPNNVQNYFQPSQCQKYLANASIANGTCFPQLFTSRDVVRCHEWVFDAERTIVNEWNITCLENQWKLSLIGTSHFAGIIVGSGFFGFLADTYGRKNIFVICTILMGISGILQIVSPEYITFTALIFVHALGTSGIYPLAFILGVEMVGKKKRELTGIVLNYFYAVGEALVALIAWITMQWKVLQVTVAAPALLFISYYWFVTESVRWLLAKEKNEKAKGIVCKVAEVNKVKLSDVLLESFGDETEALRPKKVDSEHNILPVLKAIVTSRKLLVRYLITFYIWAVNAFVYYGLSLNSTSMSGNKYLNFALVCLIEIPGYTFSWITIHKWGRKPSLIFSLLLCGLTCCFSLLAEDLKWLSVLLFLAGKLGVTSAFGTIYVYTAEMYPTVIRSGGVGTSSTVARFGALLAPFVPLLVCVVILVDATYFVRLSFGRGLYVHYLPMLLFGTIALSAGLLALKLPETLGLKLPETVEEAKLI